MLRRMLARVRGEESGFTLVELLVAAMLASVGIGAVLVTFDYSRTATTTAERTHTTLHEAQRELEFVLSMEYDDVGLNDPVAFVDDATDPRYYVRDAGSAYQWDKSNTASVEALVTDGDLASSTTWQSTSNGGTRFTGRVWRFVTWYYDPLLVQTGTDQPEAKRVIVAATIDGQPQRSPIVVSSMARDPGDD